MHQIPSCHTDVLDGPVSREALRSAEASYLTIDGMTCARCALRVGEALRATEGVVAAAVILADRLAVAAYDPGRVTEAELLGAVSHAGDTLRRHYEVEAIRREPALQVGLW